MKISIARDFSKTPGARNPDEGSFSGEAFLDEKLSPAMRECIERNENLEVDLDGTEGYATSFLEASFGGLARKYSINEVKKRVLIISNDEQYLIEEIWGYIEKATDK